MGARSIWALVASASLVAARAACPEKPPGAGQAGLTILSYNDLTSKWKATVSGHTALYF